MISNIIAKEGVNMKIIEEHLGRELPFIRPVCDRFTLDSRLFQIGDGLLAKVYHKGAEGNIDEAEKLALYEYGIARRLHEGGVSVPVPKGVFLVPTEEGSTERLPSYVMEFIPGYTLRDSQDIDPKDKVDRLYQRANDELKRAKELGFVPDDLCGGNVLYDPGKDKVYLIDFTKWKETESRV